MSVGSPGSRHPALPADRRQKSPGRQLQEVHLGRVQRHAVHLRPAPAAVRGAQHVRGDSLLGGRQVLPLLFLRAEPQVHRQQQRAVGQLDQFGVAGRDTAVTAERQLHALHRPGGPVVVRPGQIRLGVGAMVGRHHVHHERVVPEDRERADPAVLDVPRHLPELEPVHAKVVAAPAPGSPAVGRAEQRAVQAGTADVEVAVGGSAGIAAAPGRAGVRGADVHAGGRQIGHPTVADHRDPIAVGSGAEVHGLRHWGTLNVRERSASCRVMPQIIDRLHRARRGAARLR